MTFYEFILKMTEAHSFQLFTMMLTAAVTLVLIINGILEAILAVVFKLPYRWIRHRTIKAAGWPPPGLDADGDPTPKEDPEEENTDEQLAT